MASTAGPPSTGATLSGCRRPRWRGPTTAEFVAASIKMAGTVIFGTLCEAATSLALADDYEQVGREASQVVSYMLSGLVKNAS